MITFRNSLAIAGALALFALPAVAQARLEQQLAPYEEAALEVPPSITLTFSDGVNLASSTFELTDEHSQPVPLQGPRLEANGKDVTVPLVTPLQPGNYTMKWRALSRAGHESTGSYTFNVAP